MYLLLKQWYLMTMGSQSSNTTMFLPEQLVTINEEQIIQTAGMIVSTDAIKKVDAMLVRQLQIGEYDG